MARAQEKHSSRLLPKITHESVYPPSQHWSCGWKTHSCSALHPAKDWGGRGAGASCAHLHVTAWQLVVQLSYSLSLWAVCRGKPPIFIHDQWFLADSNPKKYFQEMPYNDKADLGLLYCCHWEFCYWVPDFRYWANKQINKTNKK